MTDEIDLKVLSSEIRETLNEYIEYLEPIDIPLLEDIMCLNKKLDLDEDIDSLINKTLDLIY